MMNKQIDDNYEPQAGDVFSVNGIRFTVLSVRSYNIRASSGLHIENFSVRGLIERGAVLLERKAEAL